MLLYTFCELLVELFPSSSAIVGDLEPSRSVLEVDVGTWPKLNLLPSFQQSDCNGEPVRLEEILHTYRRATLFAEVALSNVAGLPYIWMLRPGDTILVEVCEREKGAARLTLARDAIAPSHTECFTLGFEADATTGAFSGVRHIDCSICSLSEDRTISSIAVVSL